MDALVQVVGCDRYGIGETDTTGYALRLVYTPVEGPLDPQVCDGPLPTGFQHDAAKHPDDRDASYYGFKDQVRLGFSTPQDRVVQMFFARKRSYFIQDEVDLLTMLEPTIGRLVRSSAGEPANGSLSVSEKRVLTLVARGASNREVAEELYVTVHTVRKHLENAYRKLGVTNRTAAALKLHVGS
jgi:DNA-binding CsgD family transcriptional regulator